VRLASQYGRYGYRRVTALLRAEGWSVNHKRGEREIRQIIDAVKAGLRGPTMAAELEALEQRKTALQTRLDTDPPPPVRLHPNLAEVSRQKVENLREALNEETSRDETVEILRGLIDEIRLSPRDDELDIYLVGNHAQILDLWARKHPGAKDTGVQITLVAGARYQCYLHLTEGRIPRVP